MTTIGKSQVFKFSWLVDELKSIDYRSELVLTETMGIIELENTHLKTKGEIHVMDDNTLGKRYQITIQSPQVIANIESANINDILNTMDRYMKGWRR